MDEQAGQTTKQPAATPSIRGRPPNKAEQFIDEKYLETVSKQPDLMDSVARQLLTLELAIPGIYASVLKLTSGEDGTMTMTADLYYVFACWLVSLVCTLFAILPRSYQVDLHDKTAIRDFFHQAALYKFYWVIASVTAFVAGLIFAIKDLTP